MPIKFNPFFSFSLSLLEKFGKIDPRISFTLLDSFQILLGPRTCTNYRVMK
jgi:hypothetical protein